MKLHWKRTLAMTLALTVTAGAMIPAASAATLAPTYDETYYATLDYYGGVRDASVVKSYRMNGNTALTDYGDYDQVINLTDGQLPSLSDGAVTFDLGEEPPAQFYFEGKTNRPFEDLPWKISLSYRLNGAPILAEDLAGKTGLVEICLDVVPNRAAPEYGRNNLVLTAATAFNEDDITSLEAQGAEVQLVGNLRTVLFLVLPGEEEHFVIRVGSEDFSSAGLVFLAVPATLQQLEKVADLKEAKEEGQDALDAMSESLDLILDTLEGMSGGLTAAANGLDQLDAARGMVSAEKGAVYDAADQALADLDALAQRLGDMDQYLSTAVQAVGDSVAILNDLHGAVSELKPELDQVRGLVEDVQQDTAALKALLGDVEGYNKQATAIAASLADTLEELNEDTGRLEYRLDRLESALRNTKGLTTLQPLEPVSVGGMTSAAEVTAQWTRVKGLHAQYEAYLAALPPETPEAAKPDFETFLKLAAYQQYCQAALGQGVSQEALPSLEAFLTGTEPGKEAAASAQGAALLYDTVSDMGEAEFQRQLELMDQVNALLPTVNTSVLPGINDKIKEVNRLVTNLTKPTADVVEVLSELCGDAEDLGITQDLTDLAELVRDLLNTMGDHQGEGTEFLTDLDQVGDLASDVAGTAGNILDRTDGLNGLLNTYGPTAQEALTQTQELSGTLQATLADTGHALSTAEGLLRRSGSSLDAGTRQTLEGLSDSLRRATQGLAQTGVIRDAKTTVTDLIDDQWDSHTGKIDGLLNMDAGATPVSMTDRRNPAPGSIQYIMRTQEIQAEEPEAAETADPTPETTTFWGRVAALFRGLWEDFKRLLHIG